MPDSTSRARVDRPLASDSVLATGAMGGWLRRERGFAVGTLDSERDDLNRAPSLPLALQGRLAGVSVTQGEGFLGASSRVWLRGPNSLMINEPLLIIDGIRTHAAAQPFSLVGERTLPSRLEDLDPESIERVEILRGAAAAAIHGPGASKGVILVTTKRGHQGPARWAAFAESGPMMEVTEFPANFGTLGVSRATGAPVANCPLASQAAGSCTPTLRRSWNPLESASPFRTGWTNGAGVSVAGGDPQLTYRAAVDHDRSTGVYRKDDGSATNAHGSIGLALAPTVDVRLTGSYRDEDLRHPSADYIALGMRGASGDDPVRRGYLVDTRALERGRTGENGRRITGALDAAWQARPGLRASAVIGYDELRRENDFGERVAAGFPIPPAPPSTDSATFVSRASDRPAARTAGVEIEATYRRWGVRARSAIGGQYLRDDDRGDTFEAFIPDDPSGPRSTSESHLDLRRASTGLYVLQHLGWQRLFVTGSLRADLPKGRALGDSYSPSVDVSWVAMSADTRRAAWVDDLRLRAAYGRGGGHLIQSAKADNSFFGIGPADETAERSTEIELGADVSLFANRVQSGITVYRATNDQGLIFTVTPPGNGGGQQILSNDARFTTQGIETSIDARLVELPGFRWDLGLRLTAHDNEVKSLPGPPLITGNGGQRVQSGEPIGAYHPGVYTFADANGDGLIAPSEVSAQVGDAPSAGSPFPTREAGLRTDVAIGRSIRVSAILDHRGGQKLFNATGRGRCAFDVVCVQQHDSATSLADQAAAVAGQSGAVAGWIEDASYTKLREVSVALAIPRAWTGAAGARVTLSGRNLFTWTSYSGLDPEVTTQSLNGFLATGDFYQPPLRSFTARLDLSW